MAAVASSPVALHEAMVPAPTRVTVGAGVVLARGVVRCRADCCGAWLSRHVVDKAPTTRSAATRKNEWDRGTRAVLLADRRSRRRPDAALTSVTRRTHLWPVAARGPYHRVDARTRQFRTAHPKYAAQCVRSRA